MTPLARSGDAETIAVDGDLGQYRAVSGLAVAGLLAGMLSILSFVHYLLFIVPLVAVVINILALRQIAEASPPLVGRKAALTGLALALISLVAAPIQSAVHERDLRVQAVQLAHDWFIALRDDKPEFAFQLQQFPTTAERRQQSPLKTFQGGTTPWGRLGKYVQEAPVGLLLKLGRRAHVRLYANEDVWFEHDQAGVRDFYVVTVGTGQDAVSFFITLGATRTQDLSTGEWQWQISKVEFVQLPPPKLLDILGRST